MNMWSIIQTLINHKIGGKVKAYITVKAHVVIILHVSNALPSLTNARCPGTSH